MDVRFLVTLLSVTDTGSFAASARQLGLTPAAVAQRVRAVEHQLGAKFFVRKGQRVAPTPACIAILPRLRMIASNVRSLASDLDSTGLGGPVRLGAISTALGDCIPGVLTRFAKQAPNAQLTIVPGTSRDLYEQVNEGKIDAAFLIRPSIDLPKALNCIVLQKQTFILITQANDSRSFDQIITESQALIYDTASWGGRVILPWIKEHVPPERILCKLDALETIVAAVAGGLGYSVVPSWPGLSSSGPVRKITIPKVSQTRDLVLVHRKLGRDLVRLLVNGVNDK